MVAYSFERGMWAKSGLFTVLGGLLFALVLWAPGNAGAAMLYDQIPAISPDSITSQDFEAEFDAFDSMAADDFVVPAGKVWSIESASVRGTSNPFINPNPPTQAVVTLFSDADGLPGSEIGSQLASITDGSYPFMEMAMSPQPVLKGGTYWIGIQARLNALLLGGPQWFWGENATLSGSPAVFRNPGGSFDSGCEIFKVRSTSCTPAGEELHPAPDQAFSLSGTETDAVSAACVAAGKAVKKAKAAVKKAQKKLNMAKRQGKAKKKKATKALKKAKKSLSRAKSKVRQNC